MCQMCNDPKLTLADMRAQMFRVIEQFGWMVQYVDDGPASFAYTIGLTGKGLPELMVEGLGPERSAELLNHAAREMMHRALGPCDLLTGPDGEQYLLGQIVDTRGMYGAIEVYGDDIAALRLTPT